MYKVLLKYIYLIGIILLASSCVSNYVVSTNAYTNSNKQHLTPNGIEIPKVGVSYQNSFVIDEEVPEILLETNVKSPLIITENKTSDKLLLDAKTYIGTPYRFGGTTRRGIDCSAFTQVVFKSNGIELPRVSHAQSQQGTYVTKEELRKGDLLFFITRGRRISHVGIVERVENNGEIFFIHASSSRGVTISSLSNSYWNARYKFGKRVI